MFTPKSSLPRIFCFLLAFVALAGASRAAAGFTDAASFGFSPEATGVANTKALQQAVDQTGTIVVSRPGTYRMAGTVYLGSNTSLQFGDNIFLKKVAEAGPFSHVFLNKGALTKTWDHHIAIEGLQIIVNGIDVRLFKEVYGLHGQVAFFYAKDVRIEHFRCLDLGKMQYGIHVCTFEDLIVNDVIIKGEKDGVHLGRGKRFTISNGIFETFDDAVALNGYDYDVGNPEMGWIEDGVVENCHDLTTSEKLRVGYFCRLVAGAWVDWRAGMEVQKSDSVVSEGRVYRVFAKPDGTFYRSITRPTQLHGSQVLDGITWVMVQDDAAHTAGVRNVTFRDIYLEKPRTGFSIYQTNDKYCRCYYPGAEVPCQKNIVLEDVRVLYDDPIEWVAVESAVDAVTIANSSLRNANIRFHGLNEVPDFGKTKLNLIGCLYQKDGPMDLVENKVPGKAITLKTSASLELADGFSAHVIPGPGTITVDSDLTGLRPNK